MFKFNVWITAFFKGMMIEINTVLVQLPTGDNPPPDKMKAHKLPTRVPLHKTIVSLQLMVSLQTMVSTIDFLILIGYGAVLLW